MPFSGCKEANACDEEVEKFIRGEKQGRKMVVRPQFEVKFCATISSKMKCLGDRRFQFQVQ
jgi:hypothetical protein